jgi:hypothetical protein
VSMRAIVLMLLCGACGSRSVLGDRPTDGGGGSFDAPRTDSAQCPLGLTSCSGVCTDLRVDPEHCGSCTRMCMTGEVCGGSDCRPTVGCGHDGEPCCAGACVVGACGLAQRCSCAAAETCNNGLDDDCDGTLDCDDSTCRGTAGCPCIPSAEVCTNTTDDDCDGMIDCADAECASTATCMPCTPVAEVCSNGADDDCDGMIDCVDPACADQVCGSGRICSGSTCCTQSFSTGDCDCSPDACSGCSGTRTTSDGCGHTTSEGCSLGGTCGGLCTSGTCCDPSDCGCICAANGATTSSGLPNCPSVGCGTPCKKNCGVESCICQYECGEPPSCGTPCGC